MNVLLGLIASLIGGLIWVVKAMQSRSDKMIEQRSAETDKLIERSDRMLQQRDDEVRRSMATLESAVASFQRKEERELEMQGRMIKFMDENQETQAAILGELRHLHASVPRLAAFAGRERPGAMDPDLGS